MHPLEGRVLVAETAYLGDVTLTTALLRGIRRGIRPQQLDLLLGRRYSQLLDGSPDVDRVVCFDKREADSGLRGLIQASRRLRGQYDAALVPVRSLRTAMLVAGAGIPWRSGFSGGLGSALYTRASTWEPGLPQVERLASLAPEVPWAEVGLETHLAVTAEEQCSALDLLREAGLDPQRRTVAVHPGSTWATKRWPPERFGEVVRSINSAGTQVCVLGTAEDAALGEIIVKSAIAPEQVANLCGRTGLGQLKALLAHSVLLLTNDSGPMHVAEAVGTPVVAVFGSTTTRQGFAPRDPRSRVVEIELECRPCGRHGRKACPLGHFRCMLDLPATRVLGAVQSVL